MALSFKQEKFIAAYVGPCNANASAAARAAGYSGTDASINTTAWRLLRNADVSASIDQARARIRSEGIANRESRVRSQNDRWTKLHAIVEARAEAYADETPGADTGLLIKQLKVIGTGKTARTVEEWGIDTGLLGELRALEQHAAKELGQWTDKQEHTGPGGGPILHRDLSKLTIEELNELERLSDKASAEGGDSG